MTAQPLDSILIIFIFFPICIFYNGFDLCEYSSEHFKYIHIVVSSVSSSDNLILFQIGTVVKPLTGEASRLNKKKILLHLNKILSAVPDFKLFNARL